MMHVKRRREVLRCMWGLYDSYAARWLAVEVRGAPAPHPARGRTP